MAYHDLPEDQKAEIRKALIELRALPCIHLVSVLERGGNPPTVCDKGLSVMRCEGDDCDQYQPDLREEMVERIAWVMGWKLRGFTTDQAIKFGMLRDQYEGRLPDGENQDQE